MYVLYANLIIWSDCRVQEHTLTQYLLWSCPKGCTVLPRIGPLGVDFWVLIVCASPIHDFYRFHVMTNPPLLILLETWSRRINGNSLALVLYSRHACKRFTQPHLNSCTFFRCTYRVNRTVRFRDKLNPIAKVYPTTEREELAIDAPLDCSNLADSPSSGFFYINITRVFCTVELL